MSNNGLTPIGKHLNRDSSDKIKLWHKNTLVSQNRVKSALFCVLTIDTNWMQKGYINAIAEISFDNEHQAIEYIDNWHKSHKGYARIITPSI